MDININQLIDYFAHNKTNFINVFPAKVEAKSPDEGRSTTPHLCGLVIPLSGKAKFTLANTTYELNGNQILHASPRTPFKVVAETNLFEYLVIHYESERRAENEPFVDEHYVIPTGPLTTIHTITTQLIEVFGTPGSLAIVRSKTCFAQVIEQMLVAAKSHAKTSHPDKMLKAIDYIHTHYQHPLSVSEIANDIGIERRRFAHLFEQHTGMAPSTYIAEYRITKAKSLLRAFKNPIAEIAEHVGFTDSFYFSRVFKKHTGVSPTQYRMQINDRL